MMVLQPKFPEGQRVNEIMEPLALCPAHRGSGRHRQSRRASSCEHESPWIESRSQALGIERAVATLLSTGETVPLLFYIHILLARLRLTLVGLEKDIDGMGSCSAP